LRLEIDNIPKTFRDAVLIARGRGIRYLWIDSLSILQDSAEDWEREASSVSAVYANGYVMIAAAAFANCHEGCFASFTSPSTQGSFELAAEGRGGRRSKVYTRLINLLSDYLGEFCHRRYDCDGNFKQNALDTRGWTLQSGLVNGV
jgi:hypothetical protein